MVFVELSALAVARHIGIFQSEALFTAIQGQIWFNMNIAEEGMWSVLLNAIYCYMLYVICYMLYIAEEGICSVSLNATVLNSDAMCANPEQ